LQRRAEFKFVLRMQAVICDGMERMRSMPLSLFRIRLSLPCEVEVSIASLAASFKNVFQISLRSGTLMPKARSCFPKKMRPFRSCKAFLVACVYQFRQVRFGHEIRDLTRFRPAGNRVGFSRKTLPFLSRAHSLRQSLNADMRPCFTQPQDCRFTKVT
jgi:hypothetical protein